jgi:hypothetical protein
MQDQLKFMSTIRWDRKPDRTYVSLKISVPSAFVNSRVLDWKNYIAGAVKVSIDSPPRNRRRFWCGQSIWIGRMS